MQLPPPLVHSLRNLPGYDEQAFVETHQLQIPLTSIRLNPLKSGNVLNTFQENGIGLEELPWAQEAFYLDSRPSFTFDPLFHAGCYYVQEASSMFIEHALKQTVDLGKPLKVLDLCAAPGGKSTHLQSLISKESLLVSNEVIRQRTTILKDNIIQWGTDNVVVTNNDPAEFSKLRGYFDIILVDAPCSGSGLFRRDPEAINEWSENNVTLCNRRQQRILTDIMPALKEDGLLLYSTCSYSAEENEEITDWLVDHFSLISLRIDMSDSWNIVETRSPDQHYGYRFWPHRVKGEGFFLAAFRKHGGGVFKNKSRSAIKPVTRQLRGFVQQWANIDNRELISVNNKIYCWPETLFNEFDWLVQQLRVVYSGTLLGELAHQKLIPDHALAMSRLLSENLACTELSLSDAILYLQKKIMSIGPSVRGWQPVTYKSYPLGWINALPGRINNYYPKELRILKERP